MTNEEAKHKMDFLKKAYQKLIDEKVDSGKLVGDGVMGEWKAETPIDEVYKDMIEALDLAIKALEQQPKTGRWIWKSGKMIDYCSCSVCKKGQWEIEWNYCPNCGAKMAESESDD